MLDRPNNSIDRPRIFTQDSLLPLGRFKQVGEHLCRTEAQPKGSGPIVEARVDLNPDV